MALNAGKVLDWTLAEGRVHTIRAFGFNTKDQKPSLGICKATNRPSYHLSIVTIESRIGRKGLELEVEGFVASLCDDFVDSRLAIGDDLSTKLDRHSLRL